MMGPPMTARETLALRNRYISDSCRLHYTRTPLKIVKAAGQYMYSDSNERFLDCTSRTSAVGHCHEKIVSAACSQISQLSISSNNQNEEEYSQLLLSTLPDKFNTCLFTNSGGEANDIALQLARRYTKKSGVVVVDGAFHGSVVSLMDISPKAFRVSPEGKKSWVHVIPCPNWYRGAYKTEEEASEKYFQDAVEILENVKDEIGCFICEPLLVVPGCIVPPKGWLGKIYKYIQDKGGVVIADEIVTGLGRTGSDKFWAFEELGDGAVPDIVTVGKALGNGYPIAAVLITKRIAEVLTEDEKIKYRCGPVGTVAGLAVMKVIEDENLLANVEEVGAYFRERLIELKNFHYAVGDVRGRGLLNGVEIIRSGRRKVPATDLAERMSYKFKERGILVNAEGELDNVLVFVPPFCITKQDIDNIIDVFDDMLSVLTSDVNIFAFLGEPLEGEIVTPPPPFEDSPRSVHSAHSSASSVGVPILDYNTVD